MNKEELLKLIEGDNARHIKIAELIKELNSKINSIIIENSWKSVFFLGGSIAKGTDLAESDLDVFILFREKFDPHKIVKQLKLYFPDAVEEYSEHPYIKIYRNEIEVDIVPAYFIEEGEKIKTAVDRTPLHVRYVKDNLDDRQKKEAKILKFFFRKIGVYGAESSIRGFSGYAAELLINKFNTFEGVLDFFRESPENVRIALKKEHESFLPKFNDPIVLIDPVDPNRNVTANVSRESLSVFKLASKLFNWEYSDKFFFPVKKKFKIPPNSIAISVECNKCNENTVISNLRRVATSISKSAEIYGFKVIYFSTFLIGNRGLIIFLVDSLIIGETRVHKGPNINMKNVEDFIEKWKNSAVYGPPFIIGEDLLIVTDRKFTRFEDYLLFEIKRNYLAHDLDLNSLKILKNEEIGNLLPEGILANNLYFLL